MLFSYTFIPLWIGFAFWAAAITLMGLNRGRFALNIMRHPDNDYLFEKKLFNKEGARMGMFFSFAIVMILALVYLILLAVKVDSAMGGPFTNWKRVFIPLWIALGFTFIGILFAFRLLRSWVAFLSQVIITGCCTAICATIYMKIEGRYPASASWYKCLVPLWLLDAVLLSLLFWHVFVRTVFVNSPHPITTLAKSKKQPIPETLRDQAASVPLGVCGVFICLFEVNCVIKAEGVWDEWNLPWSLIWLWWWLACLFGWVWCLTYRFRPRPKQGKAAYDPDLDSEMKQKN